MAKILVYTTDFCPYCVAAKRLLDGKNVAYEEIKLSGDHEERMELMEKANGMRTVPQVFIDDQHIGGFDELKALDQQGKLDPLL